MINEIVISDEQFTKKGRMKKCPLLMQPAELKIWEEQETAYVRNYLFSIDQPLVYKKDGIMVAEYADGRIQKI
jgi:hypothetical protein